MALQSPRASRMLARTPEPGSWLLYDHSPARDYPAKDCGFSVFDWRPARQWAGRLPPGVRRWLLDEGSLTARLVALSGGDFRVEVLAQGWRRPAVEEARRLGQPAWRHALVRDVALIGRDQPWVFAHSVIPGDSLSGRLRYLRRLGSRSLGSTLFRDPGLQRGEFEIARLPADHPIIPVHLRGAGRVWARRSRFLLHGQPLLVCEVFLRQELLV